MFIRLNNPSNSHILCNEWNKCKTFVFKIQFFFRYLVIIDDEKRKEEKKRERRMTQQGVLLI